MLRTLREVAAASCFFLGIALKRTTYTALSWKNHFLSHGVDVAIVNSIMPHIARMIDRGVPVILEFRHLAKLLGRTPRYLASAVNGPRSHYRIFQIQKRSGGSREVSAPYPALLECQQWILANILSMIEVHSAAHGFVSGRDIRTNASSHLNRNAVLKMDLKDFFPSIGISRVIRVFRDLGYAPNVAFYLASLCCVDNKLPQGAATSPYLSNIIARKLDARLEGLATKLNATYTRYADDIVFSANHLFVGVVKIVKEIVEEEGFVVNEDKTRLCRSPSQRIVTGISICEAKPHVPKSYKRKLRQEVNYVRRFGVQSHMNRKRIRDPFYRESLLGKLGFWLWVEPECEFARNAIQDIRNMGGGE